MPHRNNATLVMTWYVTGYDLACQRSFLGMSQVMSWHVTGHDFVRNTFQPCAQSVFDLGPVRCSEMALKSLCVWLAFL